MGTCACACSLPGQSVYGAGLTEEEKKPGHHVPLIHALLRRPSLPVCRWSPNSSLTDIYSPSAAPLPMRRGGLTSLFGLAPSYISLAAKSE